MPEAWSNALPFDASTSLWDDMRCPVSSLSPGASSARPIVYGPSGGVRIRGFDGAAVTEDMDFTAQIPHCYKEGTDLEAHVHWCPTSNNAGNVIWHLDYYWLDINAVIPVLTTIDTGAVAAGGTAWKHLLNEFTAVLSGAGKLISSMIMCRIWRDPTLAGDTYPNDAGLLEVDFHFQVDSAGSRQEFLK